MACTPLVWPSLSPLVLHTPDPVVVSLPLPGTDGERDRRLYQSAGRGFLPRHVSQRGNPVA
eukprot:6400290-Amphidinium_carterae.1